MRMWHFLSDDSDSKILQEIIRHESLEQMQVYSRQEALSSCEKGSFKIIRSDRRDFYIIDGVLL